MSPQDWTAIKDNWSLRPGVTYLNHGSFGPSPKPVIEAREHWSRLLEAEPMDFFVRTFENDVASAAERLGRFVGASGDDLLFVPNATVAMNIVAASVKLGTGDQILATNHEYGAVLRIWRDVCRSTGAELVVQRLPEQLGDDQEIADTFLTGVTDRTKLIIVSHVASPTAVILPVQQICDGARKRGVPVCIDGPHAPAMVDVNLKALRCDYYCASLHKWVSAPFGSGFLYVAKKRQQTLRTPLISWGGSLSGRKATWKDEFTWFGTHDPAPYLAVPTALDFLENIGLDNFRSRAHDLAMRAHDTIVALTGLPPLASDVSKRYGSMIPMPLPPLENFEGGHGRPDPLQVQLWQEHQIEVPIMHWGGHRLLRVSCHLYNDEADVDRLASALKDSL